MGKVFLLATLCIFNTVVLEAFAGQSEHNIFIARDMRGYHEPKHKLFANNGQFIKDHIESFPIMGSHYCRDGTSRKYLEPGLNIVKMH